MYVFIDVDGTLIDQNDNCRPKVRELFEKLASLNVKIIVWSAGGEEYAEQKLNRVSHEINYDLDSHVKTYWRKAWYSKIILNEPKFFIDDEPALLEAR